MQMTETEKIRSFHDEFYRDIVPVKDTFQNMSWDEFIQLIESMGFKKGFEHTFWRPTECREIIYYREDGLIVWATESFKNQVNSGSVHGELRLNDRSKHTPNIKTWSSDRHGNDLVFEIVVENGVFKTLEDLLQHGTLKKQWDHHHFLWFVNHRESKAKDYNFERITKEKIAKLPQECIDILEPERRI